MRRLTDIARPRRRATLLALSLVACLLLPAAAQARKLGNSGTSTSFTATVTDGSIKVGSKSFGFDSSNPVTITGTVNNTTGAISVPAAGFHFPTLSVDTPIGAKDVHINVVDTVTGTINPLNSATPPNFVLNNLKVWIGIDDLGDCHIGSSGSPILVSPLTVGTSGSVSGTPYNPADGTAKQVNGTFAVPGASGCSVGIGVNDQVNDAVGIPSSSGNNNAQFTLDFNPTLTKGVNASFTTSQPSPTPPLSVSFDGSASTRTCSPNTCSYQWDFDNNGTIDQTTSAATTTHQYGSPGNYTAKLTVVDTDGDKDSTTRSLSVALPPDLTIEKSHDGNLLAGINGSYTIDVSNIGDGPTQGATTVTDTLPTGLAYVNATGTGWSCGAIGQVVTCTRSSAIAAGTSAPSISLSVAVASNAPASVTNTATVATPSLPPEVTSNNSSSDPTTIDRIDLAIAKSHDHDFNTGAVETYHLSVTNNGSVATTGTTTVSDTLPGGIAYQGFSAPAGWDCSASGQAITCTQPNPIGASDTQTVDLKVVAGSIAVPAVTNTATVATPNEASSADNSSSDPTTVVPTVDLTIDKSHTGGFRIGSAASWTISVQNRGARPTAGTTTVHDTLPDGVNPTGASGDGWDCQVSGQDVDCTSDDSLAASETAPLITIDAQVTATAARPSVTNTATVSSSGTGDDADSNAANDSDSDPTTIAATDLTIDKSHVGGFPLGGQGTYTLTVSNVGNAPTAGTTTVTDTLPADLTFVSAAGTGWSCGATGQDLTCTRSGSISAGQTAPAITLVVDVANTEDVQTINSASVSTPDDVNSANDSDTDPTPLTAADLQLTKTHSGDFRVGTTRAYLLKVSNVGSQPTTGESTVTDELPDGLTYAGATGSGWSCGAEEQEVTCTRAASIASGGTAPAITIQVAVGTGAYPGVTNTAQVANHDDRNSANDSASDPTIVTGSDLALSTSHQGSLQVNARATYLINVSNEGTADTGSPAVVTDTLPAGLTFAGSPSQDWDCSAAGQQVTCEHPGSIPAGQDAETLELRADVDPNSGSEVTNAASVALSDDVNPANDSDDDTAAVGRIDLAIDKSHTGDLPRGDTATYTLEVSNEGSDSTRGTTHVSDSLPTHLSYAGAEGDGWICSASGGVVGCNHSGAIAAGDSTTVTLHTDVAPGAGDEITNSASVSTPGDADDSNDSDSDPGSVTASGDAAIAIHPNGQFRVGDDASYRLTVRSVGTGALAGPITVEAPLPAGLGYVSGGGDGFDCSAAGQDVTCTDADAMPADTRSDIDLEVAVAKEAAPSVTASATVDAPGDGVSGNDSDSVQTPVSLIDLAIAMQHTGSFGVGAASSFVIDVENLGSADTVSPPRVTDTLPAGLTFNSGSGTGWSCSVSGQNVTCVAAANLAAEGQANPLTLTVTPQLSVASQSLQNQASVTTTDDADSSNDSVSDTVAIGAAPPPQTTPTPPGTGQVAGAKAKKCKKKKGKKSATAAKSKKCKKKKRK